MKQAIRFGALTGRVLVAVSVALFGCTSTVPPRLLPSRPTEPRIIGAQHSGAAVGLVLTGGGAFGAWEVGALQALFEVWQSKYAEAPPIVAVAGTSTGALIAPFTLLGPSGLANAAEWYTSVNQNDLALPKLGALLPFPLFAITTSSAYRVGYSSKPIRKGSLLYGRLLSAIPEARIEELTAMWPSRRLVAASLDFCSGRPDPVTNSPGEARRLREAILASAMAPLAFPPIPLPSKGDRRCPSTTPHLDGSLYSVAPFGALFDLVSTPTPLPLTHIIVVSAFPIFPSDDSRFIQRDRFPSEPKFRAIADRMTSLISEAGATSDIRLARSALAMRKAGLDTADVWAATGLRVSDPIPVLIELVPHSRLGWRPLSFNADDMKQMLERGYEEARAELLAQFAKDTAGPLSRPH